MTSPAALTWPQRIFLVLPLTLFLPIGVMYGVVAAVLLALCVTGEFREKWQHIKLHPFTKPVLIYSTAMLIGGLYSDWSRPKVAGHLGHYLTYLFLLCFLALGGGAWKERALQLFYLAAVLGATVFYLSLTGLVPPIKIFESFLVYQGGKSILIGMLLAVAVGWLLLDFAARFSLPRLLAVAYISGALLFIAKGRIGYILFVVVVLMMAPRLLHLSRRASAAIVVSVIALSALAWNYSEPLRHRAADTVADIENYSEGDVKKTSTALRLQMIVGTMTLTSEKPWFGHGMASWVPTFHGRYGELMGIRELTPHNEYLLYAFELGAFGLGALLWLWWMQWRIARRIGGEDGARLVMLTAVMVVAALFNALLRDGTYGMAFMVLLAIPFAGARIAPVVETDRPAVRGMPRHA